ncbi:MAG: hypothetical protein J6F30_08135 [Cellulosilyticum sp.]|nr:hypothetical protein [Cellulosilyticum sp.]
MNALTRFETDTPVRYDIMNRMCAEVEARDTEVQEQINVLNGIITALTTKTNFLCTANSGFEIISQECFVKAGFVSINCLVQKIGGSPFTINTMVTPISIPSIYNTLESCLGVAYRKVGYAIDRGVVGQTDSSGFSVKILDNDVYALRITGVYPL